MPMTVTAATVDQYIATALTHIESGNLTEAKRYLTLAQVAKKALHSSESEDGKSHTWDAEIRDALAALATLEAALSKSACRKRTIKVSMGFGR